MILACLVTISVQPILAVLGSDRPANYTRIPGWGGNWTVNHTSLRSEGGVRSMVESLAILVAFASTFIQPAVALASAALGRMKWDSSPAGFDDGKALVGLARFHDFQKI